MVGFNLITLSLYTSIKYWSNIKNVVLRWILSNKSPIAVVVSDDVRSKLQEIANETQKASENKIYLSDIVRIALQEYFDKRNIDLEVTVNRGGDRIKRD